MANNNQGMEISLLSNKCTTLLSRLDECFKQHDISGENIPYNQYVESTVYKNQITWIFKRTDIENIESLKCIKSTCVDVNFLDVRKVWLEIHHSEDFPRGSFLANLQLHFNNLPENVCILCDISILNNNQDIVWGRKFCGKSSDVNDKKIEFPNCSLGFERRTSSTTVVKLFVKCRLKLFSNTYKCTSGKLTYVVNETANTDDSVKSLLKSGNYSDVVLKTESSDLNSHKCILALKSPAFRILLNLHPGNELELRNENYVTMKDVLNFLYTENIEINNFKHAWELHTLAHKYEILNLKDLCSAYLNASLTGNNVARVLDLARENSDMHLLAACIAYIKDHRIEDLTQSFMGNSL